MTKILALLSLFFVLSAATNLNCSYTENLRDFYGFDTTITTARTYSDLKYCNTIKNGPVCCTDTDINSIADISNEYIQNLTTLVSTRDTYITNIKNNLLSQIQTDIDNFNTVSKQFIAKFEQMMAQAESDQGSDDQGSDDQGSDDQGSYDDGSEGDSGDEFDLLDSFSYITNLTSAFVENINDIKADYGTYQTTRRTCVLEMVDLQNAAMCLSCDPNAETNGFVDNTDLVNELVTAALADEDASDYEYEVQYITALYMSTFYFNIDDTVCERLQTACKPYIKVAQGQNQIIEAALAVSLLTGLTSAMQAFNNGNYETAVDEITNLFNVTDDADLEDALVLGSLPYGCDVDGECDWICDGLFVDGVVDPTALLVGGEYEMDFGADFGGDSSEEYDGGRRMRRRMLGDKKRRLGSTTTTSSTSKTDDSNGSWAPAEGSSGVTVSFAVDPANTNSQKKFGSLNLGNVFVGMMVVISSILLF